MVELERELEVLQLIAEGLTNQEIATRLYISL
ncbi:MAG: LuxR C-terminal-related transcriptional regulator, partial [Candidatus Thorarchaeota archaeon]